MQVDVHLMVWRPASFFDVELLDQFPITTLASKGSSGFWCWQFTIDWKKRWFASRKAKETSVETQPWCKYKSYSLLPLLRRVSTCPVGGAMYPFKNWSFDDPTDTVQQVLGRTFVQNTDDFKTCDSWQVEGTISQAVRGFWAALLPVYRILRRLGAAPSSLLLPSAM